MSETIELISKNNEAFRLRSKQLLESLPWYVTEYIKAIEKSTVPSTREHYLRDIRHFLFS